MNISKTETPNYTWHVLSKFTEIHGWCVLSSYWRLKPNLWTFVNRAINHRPTHVPENPLANLIGLAFAAHAGSAISEWSGRERHSCPMLRLGDRYQTTKVYQSIKRSPSIVAKSDPKRCPKCFRSYGLFSLVFHHASNSWYEYPIDPLCGADMLITPWYQCGTSVKPLKPLLTPCCHALTLITHNSSTHFIAMGV